MMVSDQPYTSGLYRSDFEHDACGVGFVCSIEGIHSHDIVAKGLELLRNLEHRGACGSDPETGDGAGILTHIPDSFLRSVCHEAGFALPARGDYGVGIVFLPQKSSDQIRYREAVEGIVGDEGQRLLGWRRMPTDSSRIGEAARESEPAIWQFFVAKGDGVNDTAAFERKLYLIRKVLEKKLRQAGRPPRDEVYIPSLSCQTIVYKGMLTTAQLGQYYTDLQAPAYQSALAMVHSRFSTNTFPQWSLAQPFRSISHNGEINTLRGNINWMRARQALFASPHFGPDIEKLIPILDVGASDSQIFDNALELLRHTGRSLPHAVMMMIPEAWEHHESMDDAKRAFYDYHSCLMEPWDGPATIPFTDGRYIGAVLDRNGLRPSRYTVTSDGLVVLASETGVLDIDPGCIVEKGRLHPGKMFLVDLEEQRIVSDEEIKKQISNEKPYRYWLNENLVQLDELPEPFKLEDHASLHSQFELLQLFGYTQEDREILLPAMFIGGKEALGSMGDDTPLAALSEKPRLLYDYFKQLFAQVTNPPLDAIREAVVTSLYTNLGAEGNLLEDGAAHCRRIRLEHPFLLDNDLERIRAYGDDLLQSHTLPIVFRGELDGKNLEKALKALCEDAKEAVDRGASLLILSDRAAGVDTAPIPALLATAAVHHHLIRTGRRTRCSLIVESGEPREPHHFCTLIGFGADAINPYLALQLTETILDDARNDKIDAYEARYNYIKALKAGILKVMSKMGISTVQSYRGAQIFEAVGIGSDVIDRYFTATPSRISGIGLDVIAREAKYRYDVAFNEKRNGQPFTLSAGGRYQWRRDGEHHHFNPLTILHLQHASRTEDAKTYEQFSRLVNEESKRRGTLRGLLSFKPDTTPIPLEEVEPWTEIVKRFKTGAMSYGSISKETHETLAIAMNKLGGRSNTGEGGESPERYDPNSKKRSRIKQVASGRFGVTIAYLASADEIQIKMAQGAKPGEGGQLPGEKVYPWIAKVRHSTPHVGLISPPPHHDIYSIEDLAQLIFDLKNTNPKARITVKLVSEVGVGTIAAGVAKGKADVVLISGHDGGTGASPQTSIMHAGLPWELGLAETHQTLTLNGLRNRIKVECDGQLKTGRDVAIACLLGAEEFGFATAPLIALGCIMMRKCHLNTCPVGIATQDPELRKQFKGEAEHVVNYFHFVAEELRSIMAELGVRSIDEMKGRVELLEADECPDRWKARFVDVSALIEPVEVPARLAKFDAREQDHGLESVKDRWLIERAAPALENATPVTIETPVYNSDRTFGAMLSGEIAGRYGVDGLPEGTISIECKGSAGQSFGAFGAPGLSISLRGDANDYFGKGLSGAKLILRPPADARFVAEENIIVGNVALYGATNGEVFIRGIAGERFAVRNSGAIAVVEGVGDHGCEYMTGGRVVVLGHSGRNFAAGMSGGIAYVFDEAGDFGERRCNLEMVDLEKLEDDEEIFWLLNRIEKHAKLTGSTKAYSILLHWEKEVSRFVKVMPVEYRRALVESGVDKSPESGVRGPESRGGKSRESGVRSPGSKVHVSLGGRAQARKPLTSDPSRLKTGG